MTFFFVSLLFFTWPFIFLSCISPQKISICPSLTYFLLTYLGTLALTIYEENMLTHQASLKKSICEKNLIIKPFPLKRDNLLGSLETLQNLQFKTYELTISS